MDQKGLEISTNHPFWIIESGSHESVQFTYSVMSDSLWPHGLWHTRFPVHRQLLELAQTHRVSNAIQPSHPVSSPSPPAFSLSQNSGSFQMSQFFTSGGQRIGVSASASSFQWIFRIDWLHLLAVQGTLKSLLQHHSSKASILRCSAFFIVQLSHPYMTTGKTIALTRWTFVGKVMSLLFNTLSRLVIAFLPKEQASFNFMAAVTICSDFGAPRNKVCHCFHCFHDVQAQD